MSTEKNVNENVLTFNSNSDEYFKNRPRYPAALYDAIFEHCNEYNCAWDCGCGNGQVAIDLVPRFNHVEASDINENQIVNAFKHERIHYSIQNAESPEFPDNHFDLLCVAQCMHWFNLDIFFQSVRRVLKKDGIFACWGYGDFHINNEIDHVLDTLLLSKIDPFWAAGNRIVQNGYKDVTFPFDKIQLPPIEMNVLWDVNQLANYMDTWSAVKLYNNAFKTDIIAEIKLEISSVMKGPELVKMDFSCFMGRMK